ncbi:MAG: hypothetical protein ACT6QU_14640 [Aliihoeflea sp.]|uniref:hypothetical protein n=1 Tax=Aliihoeflea sp. TaxID=2608088 RepID=UPI0040347AC8
MPDVDAFFEAQDEMQEHLESRFPWLKPLLPSWRYEIGKGWLKILEDFFAEVEAAMAGGKGFQFTMVGRRLGRLRVFYLVDADVPADVEARIAVARQLAIGRAYSTCEVCGAPGQIYSIHRRWVVSCEAHVELEDSEVKPFRRITDYTGTISGSLQVQYPPEQDRLVRVARWRERSVISEKEDADLLAEATRAIEAARAAERLADAQEEIAGEGKMSDLDPDATEIDMMEEASRLQREARDDEA